MPCLSILLAFQPQLYNPYFLNRESSQQNEIMLYRKFLCSIFITSNGSSSRFRFQLRYPLNLSGTPMPLLQRVRSVPEDARSLLLFTEVKQISEASIQKWAILCKTLSLHYHQMCWQAQAMILLHFIFCPWISDDLLGEACSYATYIHRM